MNLLRWNDLPRTSRTFSPKIPTFSQFRVYLNVTQAKQIQSVYYFLIISIPVEYHTDELGKEKEATNYCYGPRDQLPAQRGSNISFEFHCFLLFVLFILLLIRFVLLLITVSTQRKLLLRTLMLVHEFYLLPAVSTLNSIYLSRFGSKVSESRRKGANYYSNDSVISLVEFYSLGCSLNGIPPSICDFVERLRGYGYLRRRCPIDGGPQFLCSCLFTIVSAVF